MQELKILSFCWLSGHCFSELPPYVLLQHKADCWPVLKMPPFLSFFFFFCLHLPPSGTWQDLQLACTFAFPSDANNIALNLYSESVKIHVTNQTKNPRGDLHIPSILKHKKPWYNCFSLVKISEVLCKTQSGGSFLWQLLLVSIFLHCQPRGEALKWNFHLIGSCIWF